MKEVARESLSFAGDVLQRTREIWKAYVLAIFGVVGVLILALCVGYLVQALLGAASKTIDIVPIPPLEPLLSSLPIMIAIVSLYLAYRARRELRNIKKNLETMRRIKSGSTRDSGPASRDGE